MNDKTRRLAEEIFTRAVTLTPAEVPGRAPIHRYSAGDRALDFREYANIAIEAAKAFSKALDP
jgi:hypothetical protein